MDLTLPDLADFVTEHRACGMMTAEAGDVSENGYLLSVACPCGVTFWRWITPAQAAADLIWSRLLLAQN